MKTHHLDYCEFYITNVCNLNCTNCNRFNNYAFSGHQNWQQYRALYQQWAEILDIGRIAILGGEPMLHPDFMSWLTGVADLWPEVEIKIITNGTQMHRWPELYKVIQKYHGRIWIEINVHRADEYNDMVHWVQTNFLRDNQRPWNDYLWHQNYEKVRDPSWPDCNSPDEFDLLPDWIRSECAQHGLVKTLASPDWHDIIDSNLVRVAVCQTWKFYPSAVKFDGEKLTLHNSDPDRAMAACMFKPCHHFIRGALYKCGPVALFPDFLTQFPVSVTDDERDLINSYKPALPNWDHDDMNQFMQNLRSATPIDQCRFCPENTNECGEIASSTKKIRIQKLLG